MTDVTIEEMPLPASLDGPEGAAFAEMVAVRNEIEAAAVGNYDLAETPAVILAQNSNPYEPLRLFVARGDGRIVGRSLHELQSGDDLRSAWVTAEVLPEFRRRGIGTQLFERALEIAVADGRSIVQSFAMHSMMGGDRIDSPTGFGSVPRDDPGARFLAAKGFELAQVDRMSRLPLPSGREVPDAPPGYELEQWVGATPERRLGDIAALQQRMSTDVPLGETDHQPELWDEERVRDLDRRRLSEGRHWMITAARHVASDSLVAFTELVTAHDTSRPAFNNSTLVLHEHRGRRLGMLVKAANLRLLKESAPGHPSVYTWNAEENRHMLDVNEAIGFVPVGYEGSWKRSLA
ncbi:acetyltransferase (GNAT) family protein [Homoserinimonas aerilata]|uniref:Acetyltransferase (GNAT) family protein n=1 Tax=Homoserinimonas aerilata TaxID=1162970 RepID=A0A542YHL0_9MICO|nr:GNAT family N-acetyltransferase [Homoserinimonas aerilata]TQL47589.1 acetyltransferase (GNAT) family protein [Homoserinimonas aerilata]